MLYLFDFHLCFIQKCLVYQDVKMEEHVQTAASACVPQDIQATSVNTEVCNHAVVQVTLQCVQTETNILLHLFVNAILFYMKLLKKICFPNLYFDPLFFFCSSFSIPEKYITLWVVHLEVGEDDENIMRYLDISFSGRKLFMHLYIIYILNCIQNNCTYGLEL